MNKKDYVSPEMEEVKVAFEAYLQVVTQSSDEAPGLIDYEPPF